VIILCTFASAVGEGRTEEGLDYMFAANYLGHFLLTMLLLGKSHDALIYCILVGCLLCSVKSIL